MKQWLIKKGNTSVQDIPIYDKDGVLITNLAIATEIKFQIKKNKTDAAALVEKTDSTGGGIEVNTPSTGYLRITLLPEDTGVTLSKGDYYMACQITWSATEIYEVDIYIDNVITEQLRIKQDIIQS